ncbi:hypothetical protein ILUMI_16726 [Ignelater luminosus]|uniref:Uncharacterized protein n=1 Tax=Ignelater luminosus TaxID=2038154 RepID=A0A8K0CSD3_IGNLU|nr:hypothetical protein ILUMI_16726 [Ignelater luminosus]
MIGNILIVKITRQICLLYETNWLDGPEWLREPEGQWPSITLAMRADVSDLKFYQDDYTVKLEVLHLVSYNRSYLRDAKADFVWYNRTARAINASGYLLKDVGMDFKANMETVAIDRYLVIMVVIICR